MVALVVRLFALKSWNDSIYEGYMSWDESMYHTWAIDIANGEYAIPPLSDMAHLPTYLMALIYSVFPQDPISIRILNIVLGVAFCFLLYLFSKELFNETAGFAALFIACIYKPFIFYSIVLLKTNLSLLLFSISLYFFSSSLKRKSLPRNFWSGFAFGLLLNVRQNSLAMAMFVPFITIFLLKQKEWSNRNVGKAILLFLVGFIFTTGPFIYLNYRITERGSFAPTGGFNLYLGSNLENPYPYYRPVSFAVPSPTEQSIHFIIEASRRKNRRLSPHEASSYFTQQTLMAATEQPLLFLKKIMLKTAVIFNRFEEGDNYNIAFLGQFIPIFNFIFFEYWTILPFGMAGILMLSDSEKIKANQLLFVIYTITLILFFTNTRLRLPMVVFLIPFAVSGIQQAVKWLIHRKHPPLVLYSSIVALFFIIEFLPIRGTNDLTAPLNIHAINLYKKGQKQEAVNYWAHSLKLNGSYSEFAALALAAHYISLNTPEKAMQLVENISDNSFAAAYKYEKIGDILRHSGDLAGAKKAYEKALEINSGQRRVMHKLIRLYQPQDSLKALQMKEKLSFISSFYSLKSKDSVQGKPNG